MKRTVIGFKILKTHDIVKMKKQPYWYHGLVQDGKHVLLAEIFPGIGWCCACMDILDEKVFKEIKREKKDWYDGEKFKERQKRTMAELRRFLYRVKRTEKV